MAAFSRLQLAAALLEYDNDPDNPDAPFRSAHESAIFSRLPRNPTRPRMTRKSPDLLGVSLPSESGSFVGLESAVGDRRSRASRGSIDALRNPFGAEENVDVDVEEGEDLEVDLASWGLDSFIPKEKGSKNSRNKSKLVPPNPHPVASLRSPQDVTFEAAGHRATASHSLSLANVDNLGVGLPESTSSHPTDDFRRRSFGSPLDLVDIELANNSTTRRRASIAFIERSNSALPQHSVPFPTGSSRPESPFRDDAHSTVLNPQLHPSHGRTHSITSMGSRRLFSDDPNLGHTRTLSNATMGTMTSRALLADDNPFALEPPSLKNTSKFDPKAAAHVRTLSNASLGSRMLLDDDAGSAMTGYVPDHLISTMELLRPKVLVMPSPLQAVHAPTFSKTVKSRDGFHVSTDGPPLPPGARTARRSSAVLSVVEPFSGTPEAFNSFTPNPRISLTLSQLTFRNSLMVGGQRDVAYSDIDNALPRAVEDGEQIYLDPPVEKENKPLMPRPDTDEPARPAGKLYGKSLIDDLEDRKAQMRSKQRVFGGDDRPSMMARGQAQRSSTLIDPASLQTRPTSRHMSSFGSHKSQDVLGRRNSVKPLLSFDDDKPPSTSPGDRIPKTRSVFGVDTLWESEMAKLREIEEREAEERQRRAAEEEAREIKKRSKRQGKSKVKATDDAEQLPYHEPLNTEPRVSVEPPILPAIKKATVSGPPPAVGDDDTESESDESDVADPSRRPVGRTSFDTRAEQWYNESSSSEEDHGPRRTTGTGPRYPNSARKRGPGQLNAEDSDEDIPLAATLSRAAQRSTILGSTRPDSDDEEQPLAVLLDKTKRNLPSVNFDRPPDFDVQASDDDDDDDKPLGLRISSLLSSGDDDDNMPLAFHPEQQRRTQYNVMAQQQQQMMMQAQLQSSMFFGAPPMGSTFFGQTLATPMMGAPFASTPMTTPLHDPGKFGRVNRWRYDVAVERQP